MLEPGSKMLKIIGILVVLGFGFYQLKLPLLCKICYSFATLLGIVLWILLVIESHQDKVLNEQAIQERRENGED